MGEPLSPVSRLGHLTDVDPSGAADGQVLVWDDTAGEWVPGTATGAGLVLEDSGGQGWQVTADTDGTLVTTVTAEPGEDEVQVGPYMLSVDTDGALVTTEVE